LLNCGVIRERGIERTSTSSVTSNLAQKRHEFGERPCGVADGEDDIACLAKVTRVRAGSRGLIVLIHVSLRRVLDAERALGHAGEQSFRGGSWSHRLTDGEGSLSGLRYGEYGDKIVAGQVGW
jgi:hypothetical protein